ncbi:proton-coupled folate transporter [Aplysia californica]|uniref:Proton-coupled folate transporter n=1 Tax=Aplysia californica TaxID=6500 RepID=A0ABM0ZW27_APLCA|nr:proton-coupled folate transporter [Aplysia californica]
MESHEHPESTDDTRLLPCEPTDPQEENQGQPEFSTLRARVVSALVFMFIVSNGCACDSLLAQYLLSRIAADQGYSNQTEFDPCVSNKSDPRIQKINELQSETSDVIMYLSYLQSAPALFACVLVGSYTDYLGRRLLVLVPVTTQFLRMILIGAVIRFHLPIWVLYIGFTVDGMSGSWFSLLLALYAVAADIHKDGQGRSFWLYFVTCTNALMTSSTIVAEGYIIDFLGFFFVAVLLAAMLFCCLFITVLFLPETRKKRPQQQRVLNPLFHMRRIFGFYTFDGSVRKRVTFCFGLAIFFFGVINDLYSTSVDTRYQIHQPFCWKSSQIGIYNAVRGTVPFFLGGVLLTIMQRCVSDEKIAMFGIIFQGGGYLFEAFITHSWQFFLVPVILAPGTMTIPLIRSTMSLLAGEDRHGAMFSSIAVVETVCNMAASSVFNNIYAATVATWAGTVYVVMASFSFFTFLLFILFFSVREPETKEVVVVDPDHSIQTPEFENQENVLS